MTTNQAKPGPDGPAVRLGMWLGHYAYLLLIVQVGFSAAAHLLVAVVGGRWLVVLAVVSTLLTLLAAAAFLLQGLHDRRLCLRDINEAPLLDPDRAVHMRMRELRVHHAPGLKVTLLLAALGVVFASAFVKHAPAWLDLFYVAGLARGRLQRIRQPDSPAVGAVVPVLRPPRGRRR